MTTNPNAITVLCYGDFDAWHYDLKIEFKRSPEGIADAVKGLVVDIKQNGLTQAKAAPKVLLVSPILVNDKARDFEEYYGGVYYDAESAAKSHRLAEALRVVANITGSAFFDASTVSAAGDDGIHFSEAAHIDLAEALRAQVHDLVF